ncbi:hypothetical protein [Geoalkalibacter sp.]|uniref:hypothetical protein n=1 Tax=Geoalkalibacter sp. TaxID=3041440 RepID=UPI00272E3B9A|nr:hypothetical protein [Geoalkalibacter sp.]
MNAWSRCLSMFLLPAVLMIVSSALAAPTWVSVPSALGGSDKVVITGGGLAPFSNVTLRIDQPNGTKTLQFATIAADGTLSADYMPVAPGKYSVRVLDQNGKDVGGGDFIHK